MKPLNETEIARLAALDIFTVLIRRLVPIWQRNLNYKLLQRAFPTGATNERCRRQICLKRRVCYEFFTGMATSASITFPMNTIEYPEQLILGEDSFINANLQIVSVVIIGKHALSVRMQFFTPIIIHNGHCVVRGGSMIRQLRLGMMFGLVVIVLICDDWR